MRYRVPQLPPGTWHIDEIEVEKSRFIAWIAHTPEVDAAEALTKAARQAHPNASHHCLAYIAGAPGEQQRIGFSDDGEPGGTAGRPMFHALQGSQLGEVGCVVIRYFGGTKLGTGGLARAYAQAVNKARGLATAIGTGHVPYITAIDVDIQPLEEPAAIALTPQLTALQTQRHMPPHAIEYWLELYTQSHFPASRASLRPSLRSGCQTTG